MKESWNGGLINDDLSYVVFYHLLQLPAGRHEQFDVSGSDDLLVLDESQPRFILRREEHEGVAGRSSVPLPHKQNAVLPVQHLDGRRSTSEELQLRAERNTEYN